MKALLASLIMVLAVSAHATTQVTCRSERSIQAGLSHIATDAELRFELERNGNGSVLSKLVGHVFVKSPYDVSPGFDTENSYMGFFKTEVLSANGDYRPRKYQGFAQFNNFDAAHTVGQEDGMFGYLAVDVTSGKKEFSAFYVFQAGDHMGGTVLFSCHTR